MYAGKSMGFYFERGAELLFALNISIWLVLSWVLLIVTNINTKLKILILGLIGMAVMFICTFRYGVGVDPDSVFYISAGRNLLKGLGLSLFYYGDGRLVPMIHFPPLFPVLLSLVSLFGISFLNAARWLNIFLFGANILLIAFIVKSYTRSIYISILASFLMLTSIDMLSVHSMALTEPLFIFLTISGLYLLASYMENQRLLLLIASSVLIALAFLTRYIGVALVVAGAVGIFCFSNKRLHGRLVDAVSFVVISSTPVLLWLVRNLYVTGNLVDRKIVFHPITANNLLVLYRTLEGWVFPIAVIPQIGAYLFTNLTWILWAMALLVSGILFLKIKVSKSNFMELHPSKLPNLLGIFIISYCLLLVISLLFFDAWNYFDNRILSPVFSTGAILVICLTYKRSHSLRSMGILKNGFIVMCIIISTFYLLAGSFWIVNIYNNGQEYTSREWKQSRLMQRVKMLPPGIPIYSNGPELIYILTGRDAFKIPWKANPATREFNDQYLSKVIEMGKVLRNRGGVLVYSDIIGYKWFSTSDCELKRILPLRLLRKEADGSIYDVPRKK